MTKIQRAEMELELDRVGMAKKELAFRILKMEDEIEGLKKHIEIQIKRESELTEKLKG